MSNHLRLLRPVDVVQAVVSRLGLSRKDAISMVMEGRITVSGRVASMGDKVDTLEQLGFTGSRSGRRPSPVFASGPAGYK
jgi:16S rRNA U516 pseudouridylate synthase RsuA-like enzyme